MYTFETTNPEMLRMRQKMRAEALEFMKEIKDKNPNKRLYNPNNGTITTAEDLVEDLLYLEHDNPNEFEKLYRATKPIGVIKTKLLECFCGYRTLARAA
jgi:hypothetical protein